MTRNFLQRLPIFACAGLIASLFLISIWNFAVGAEWPKLRIRSASPLWGVPGPTPTPWTLQAFLSGETQKAFSTSLGQSLPVFPISVRAKNQFLYSVFDSSGAPNITIGRERQLFETSYIDEFCSRDGAPDPGFVDEWAARVRAIEKAVQAKGKRFVYLISPSKAARYSGYLPPHRYCASVVKHRTEKLPPYRAALDAQAVAYVDGASATTAAMPDYPINLFPRGGTHWNLLGSAVAARELTRTLNKAASSAIASYDFEWREQEEALGTDRDLLNLLNLLWPDARYPTASITGKSPGGCEKTPKIFAVGGSFLIEVVTNLVESPCSAHVDYWHYVRAPGGFSRRRFLVEKENGVAVMREQPEGTVEEFDSSLAQAEAVVLEENESVISNMAQVPDLLAAATRERQADPGSSQ